MSKIVLASALPIAVALVASCPAQADTESDAEASTIDEIVVTSRYIAEGAGSAMKYELPVRDVPFTVANYTDAFMSSIQTENVADLYKYMTGIQRSGNTGYDVSIRGFKSSANDPNSIMVDGLPGLTARFGSPPTVNLDHIEVVKGPSSVLYGQAQPGGFVNLITKKPTNTPIAQLELRADAFDGWGAHGRQFAARPGYNVDGDFGGPLGDSLSYRAVVELGDVDTFRDFGSERKIFASPSITWKLGDNTELTTALEYLHFDRQRDNFLVVPQRDYALLAPYTKMYQQPGDTEEEEGKALGITLRHQFASDAVWVTSIRGVMDEDETFAYESSTIRTNTNTTLGRRARHQVNARNWLFLDSNLSKILGRGAVTHKLLFGVSAGRNATDFDRRQFFNAPAPAAGAAGNALCDPTFSATLTRNQCSLDISIYSPNYTTNLAGLPILPLDQLPPGRGLNRRYTRNDSEGVYLSDMVTLSERWKALFAVRYSWDSEDFHEKKLAGVPSTSKSNSALLPMTGLVFQPDEHWSLYGSYSTSYIPAGAGSLDINGDNSFDPERAKQYETGVKADLLDQNRLRANLAFFRIERFDVLNTFTGGTCPASVGTCTVQSGEQRSQGAELEINAQVMESWQVALGYSYTDTEIVTPAPGFDWQQSSRLINAPLHNAHVWSRYDFRQGPLTGLGIGLGVSYSSMRLGILPTTSPVTAPALATSRAFLMPGYTTADLGLYYAWDDDRYNLTLRVANLLDEKYIETGGFSGDTQIQPGASRNIALSFTSSLF